MPLLVNVSVLEDFLDAIVTNAFYQLQIAVMATIPQRAPAYVTPQLKLLDLCATSVIKFNALMESH